MQKGAQCYKSVDLQSQIMNADPHRLIQMLMQGALDKLKKAKHFAEKDEVQERGNNISMSIEIIGGLQSSLDMETGGEIAGNLFALYDFMISHLLLANKDNDANRIDEVIQTLEEIKAGWDGIRDQVVEPVPENGTGESDSSDGIQRSA